MVCTLHIMLLSMEKKKSDWELKKLMSSMSKIFPEATRRLVNNKTVTDTTEKDYPIQFVTQMGAK